MRSPIGQEERFQELVLLREKHVEYCMDGLHHLSSNMTGLQPSLDLRFVPYVRLNCCLQLGLRERSERGAVPLWLLGDGANQRLKRARAPCFEPQCADWAAYIFSCIAMMRAVRLHSPPERLRCAAAY